MCQDAKSWKTSPITVCTIACNRSDHIDAGVPEAVIHKSQFDGLRVYERVTPAQEWAVSEISGDVNRTMEKAAEDDSNEDCKFLDSISGELF